MIEELAWINFEKRGSKLPISVLYYGGHSHDIRNQSDKTASPKAPAVFTIGITPSVLTVVHKTDSHQNGLTKPLFLWCKVKGISRNQK